MRKRSNIHDRTKPIANERNTVSVYLFFFGDPLLPTSCAELNVVQERGNT